MRPGGSTQIGVEIQKPSEYGLWISEQLAAVPEFQGLGPLFKSSPEPVALTESETEYVIRCTKHTFSDHLVFQVSMVARDPAAACAQEQSQIRWVLYSFPYMVGSPA